MTFPSNYWPCCLEHTKRPHCYLTLSLMEDADNKGLMACLKHTAMKNIKQKSSFQQFSSI